MFSPPRFLSLLLLVLPFAPSSASPLLNSRAVFPAYDSFYTPPSGYESKPPGTILKTRRVAASLFGVFFNPVEAYQLLYRTTAIDGSPIATVTTIFRPFGAKTDRIISFQTAYDSSSTTCNPSYTYQLGSLQTDVVSSLETLILQLFVLSGYIVASPDYEGPDAAFGAGRLAGTAVLDGMRAVSAFKDTLRLSTSTPAIVGYGYSGGGIATSWAASLQPSYAPELPIKGWISGGTPANLTGVLTYVDGTLFSGFLPPAIDGLRKPSAYGAQLNPLLNSIITANGASVLKFASQNCVGRDLIRFANQKVLSYDFQSLGPNLLSNPIVAGVLQQNILGTRQSETPTAPVYLFHATPDEIIPYGDAAKLGASWCSRGASVKFTTFAAGGHITTEILGAVGSLQFAAAAFAGTTTRSCTSNTVLDDSINPLALGANLEPVLVKLAQKLADIGKQDSRLKSNISFWAG